MLKCHCRDCQRLSGGPYTPVVYIPAGKFKITKGTLRHHVTQSEGWGTHRRGFCPECGSRVTGGESPGSTGLGVPASSLDDPSWFKAQAEIWTCDVQPWDPLDPTLPKYDKYPRGPAK